MKKYKITVNGHEYEVTVEEMSEGAVPEAEDAREKTAAAAAPAQGTGSIKVTSNVPGKVLKVIAPAGSTVKAGDQIIVIESMKMEIPVTAPQNGRIVSIDAPAGSEVQNGSLIATMDQQ